MTVQRSFQSILPLLSLLVVPCVAHAEIKVLTAEAAYTMGDGETPSFAEALVLQKAKQMALEQAGTYVESYTKTQNLDLTTGEVQTIAGGVLQVEIQEKERSLVGDGLQLFVKIKATMTTDKMEELAQRIKGKNVAEEDKKLQDDYARLSKEIERWKQLVVKTPAGSDRDAALDEIREREKTSSLRHTGPGKRAFLNSETRRILTPVQRCSILVKGALMATVTISLSDEEMRRLEALGKHEGLTVEQMVRLGINDFISQPDDAFRAAAKRVMEKNAELYRRLS